MDRGDRRCGMSAVADVLNGAAELIERDGWVQHHRFVDGRRCADSAIVCAALSHHGTARVKARLVTEAIIGMDLTEWNDAPGRSEAEVVATLRAAAERAA